MREEGEVMGELMLWLLAAVLFWSLLSEFER